MWNVLVFTLCIGLINTKCNMISASYSGGVAMSDLGEGTLPEPYMALVNKRVVDASPSSIVAFPFMCGLVSLDDRITRIYCSGVILTENYILTAAQCVYFMKPSQLGVIMGTNLSFAEGLRFYVLHITVHNDFTPRHGYENDLGIVRLDKLIEFSASVRPAKLPLPNSEVPDKSRCYEVGWGTTSAELHNYVPHENQARQLALMHHSTVTMDDDTCKELYSRVLDFTLLGSNKAAITDSMICAGRKTKGLDPADAGHCTGDVGGALVFNGVVIGISSVGKGCAGRNYPSVNTKLSKHVGWISHVMSLPIGDQISQERATFNKYWPHQLPADLTFKRDSSAVQTRPFCFVTCLLFFVTFFS